MSEDLFGCMELGYLDTFLVLQSRLYDLVELYDSLVHVTRAREIFYRVDDVGLHVAVRLGTDGWDRFTLPLDILQDAWCGGEDWDAGLRWYAAERKLEWRRDIQDGKLHMVRSGLLSLGFDSKQVRDCLDLIEEQLRKQRGKE